MAKTQLVLLSSGSGTLAQSIIDAIEDGALEAEISTVISDQNSPVLQRANRHHVDHHYLSMNKDRSIWNEDLFNLVSDHQPDLVVSVGFMRILAPDFVRHFKVINIHPSLLPLFPGAHAVRDALTARATETGTTVHWVDDGVDTGEVIAQVKVPIEPQDDESTLHERIKIVERELIVETIQNLIATGVI